MAGQFTRSRRLETQQQEQSRARWTTSLTKILATLMVDQVHKGNKHNNLFNKKAWKYICDEFYSKTGLKWDKEQLKNRYSVLRRQYSIVKSILDQSDFSWDESTGSITANDEIWAEYIKVFSFIFCFVIDKHQNMVVLLKEETLNIWSFCILFCLKKGSRGVRFIVWSRTMCHGFDQSSCDTFEFY